MKNTISLFAILLCLFTSTAQAQDYDFRKVRWGMSKAKVKNSETKELKPIRGADALALLETRVANMTAIIIYSFTNDKLTGASYHFANGHTNKNDHISDYEKIKGILTKKYSSPYSEKAIWKNDLYKKHKQYWGDAVSIGHLIYSARWETQRTKIELRLSGDNYEIEMVLFYSSKELEEIRDKKYQENQLDDF